MIAEVPGSRDKDSTAPSVPPRVTPPSAERLKQGVVQTPFFDSVGQVLCELDVGVQASPSS